MPTDQQLALKSLRYRRKIIEVIKHHIEGLVTGKRTAEQVMPELVNEVSGLMPKCGG